MPSPVEDNTPVGLTTAVARTVLAPLEDSGGRAELVARRLGDAIRFGLLQDGERLPAESELAAQLGVSTVTLREALTILRGQGLIVTRRGRGGGSFAQAPADRGAPLQRFSVSELRDLGDQRGAISGAAARLAAERAQPDEIQRLQEQVERLRSSTNPSDLRRANTELTIAVAAAAQSSRLTHEEARLRSEVGELLALGEVEQAVLVRDQEQLVAAIAGRDPERARTLAEQHVAWETERLIELRMALYGKGEPLTALADELQRVFAALAELAARFARVVEPAREDLEPLRPAIFALLACELVTGAGIVTAPGVLSDAPRWLEWWWTSTRSEPEALRVNLDPAAPEFYDYTVADWYAVPERTRAPRASGPYVDFACTNEYAITLSVPIGSTEFLGVAAADVLVSSLDARVVPALAALGHPAALTNADGRVIASNSPAVSPGRRIALDPAARPAGALPWLLVELPAAGPAGAAA